MHRPHGPLALVIATLVALVAATRPACADYVERFEPWTATSAGAWEAKDLSAAPFSVPAQAVVEIVIRNSDPSNERWGGVRAVGSKLDRRFQLQEAEDGGDDVLVMHVQTNGNGHLEHYAENTGLIDFVLVGYWDNGIYREVFPGAAQATADGTWQDLDLDVHGVGPGDVVEVVLANTAADDEREVGVRANGSSLERRIDLPEAESGGLASVTLFVPADATSSATVEIYAEDWNDVEFHVVGHWSTLPGIFNEAIVNLGEPSNDGSWLDLSLSGDGVPANAVVELLPANDESDAENSNGVRRNGSSLERRFQLHEAENGGYTPCRMHVKADATSTVEWYTEDEDSGDCEFLLTGYWSSSAVTVDVRVNQNDDDAEQYKSSGNMYLTSSDLELANDGHPTDIVGMRFRGVSVPNGSTITSAFIQFKCDETDSGSCNLTIKGEDVDDAPIFTNSSNDITDRTTTTASVAWSPPAWNTVGEAGANQRTPDLSSIVQEIVDRGGWADGNDMVFIIDGSGTRTAESHNGDSGGAPLLHVEYATPLLSIADHDAGPEVDAFTVSGGEANAELLGFNLDPNGGSVTVSSLVFSISKIEGLSDGDWSGVEIIVDDDDDGDIAGGESTSVGGAGTVNQSAGTITFSNPFTVAAATNYVLRADFGSLSARDSVTVELLDAESTVGGVITGATSAVTHVEGYPLGDVLLVVVDASALNAEEAEKKALFESYGYRVAPITATEPGHRYESEARLFDVVYVSETILSSDLGTKLKTDPIGVVNDEAALTDEFGISSSNATYTDSEVEITDDGHFVTRVFATGDLAICDSSQPLHIASGTLATGAEILGAQPGTSNAALLVLEHGASLQGGGAADGRRVHLPWGGSSFDIGSLTDEGDTLLRRALRWGRGPLAHWRFDDGAGGTAVESMGGFHGAATGGAWGLGWRFGAMQFDGASEYVSVPSAAALQPRYALTITAWINGDAWGSGSDVDVIVRKGEGNPNNYQLAIADGRVSLSLDGNDASGFRGDTVLDTDEWYHVAATWDGAWARIYVNGVLDNGTPDEWRGATQVDGRPVYIGGRPGADRFDGQLDDVRIYGRALSAKEIGHVMAAPEVRVTAWREVDPN